MSQQADTPEGSLERLGINVETYSEEGILTPGEVKSVKLNVTTPRGYSFRQVEAFVAQVLTSMTWYVEALHRRDQQVFQLGELLDQAETTVKYHEYNAPLRDAVSQSNSDKEFADLADTVLLLEEEKKKHLAEKNRLHSRVEELENQLATLPSNNVAGGGNDSELQKTVEALAIELEEANKTIQKQEEFRVRQEEYIDLLEAGYNEGASSEEDVAEYDVDTTKDSNQRKENSPRPAAPTIDLNNLPPGIRLDDLQ